MSDRIVVMKDGTVQQIGSPRDIYDLPHNRFVADFIGETTFLPGVFSRFDSIRGIAEVEALGQTLYIKCAPAKPDLRPGSSCTLSIRPEKVRLTLDRGSSNENVMPGVVEVVVFRGAVHEYGVRLEYGTLLRATTPASSVPALQGQPVMASWAVSDAVLLGD
jgi:ABC-type Fe3+/spermidine/putrescine transport system ATPase subunit